MPAPSKCPSNLTFSRSQNLSDCPFFQRKADARPLFDIDLESTSPVLVVTEGGLGPQATPATKEENRHKRQPLWFDTARLGTEFNALLVCGSVTVIGNSRQPHNCTDAKQPEKVADFLQDWLAFVEAMEKLGGYRVLAERYVMNLVTGVGLFRNQTLGAIRTALRYKGVEVEISLDDDVRPGVALSLDKVSNIEVRRQLVDLVKVYAEALAGKCISFNVEFRYQVMAGSGQEVYPSQLWLEKGEVPESRSRVSRHLATYVRLDGRRQAVIRAAKLANGLRRIDTWYGEDFGPMPVEAYAPEFSKSRVFRSKNSAFRLVEQIPRFLNELGSGLLSGDALYILAFMIRGGMFSGIDSQD